MTVTVTEVEVVPPLIRKKSGDIVKSSLKLLKLINQRHCVSLPNLKSVRFATRLTNIRMFDGAASPAAVSNQLSPLHSPLDDDDGELRFRRPRDYFQWNSFANGNDEDEEDDESSDDDISWYSLSNRSFELDYLDISRPHQYFYQNKVNKPVHIHSLQIITINKQANLSGLINVDNLGYEKLLMIKLTLNDWKNNLTFSNNSNIIQFNKSINENIDQFKFKINLQDLLSNYPDCSIQKKSLITMEICCKYQVNNQVFWDNNFNQNYKVILKSFTTTNNYKVSNTIKNYNYELVNEKLIKHQQILQNDKIPDIVINNSNIDINNSNKNNTIEHNNNNKTALNHPAFLPPTRTFENSNSRTFNNNDLLDSFRPKLVKSFSTSNLDQRPRYSNTYKMRLKSMANDQLIPVKSESIKVSLPTSTPTPTPTSIATIISSPSITTESDAGTSDSIDLSNTKFNSTSYTDLLAKFCFGGSIQNSSSNSSLSSKLSENSSLNRSNSSSSLLTTHCSIPSTASTLHSFSDSIHI